MGFARNEARGCGEVSVKTSETISAGSHWIRRRDKQRVRVTKATRSKVEYVTLPMLIVWDDNPSDFRRKFALELEAP